MQHAVKRHWSVDTDALRARDPEAYARWSIEQRINFGLGGERISRSELERLWNVLELDADRRRYLQFLLWG